MKIISPINISRLHYITQEVEEYTHAELAELACKGGARWVQLRVKGKPYKEWLEIAKKTQEVCKKYDAKLIINDNVLIAKEINAIGVHLGKEDTSPLKARSFLGNDFIIGRTCNSIEDIKELDGLKVDYIGLGPFRFTATKKKLSHVLGLEGLRQIIKTMTVSPIPIISIGGIKLDDIDDLMSTGVHGIAVSSAINLAADKQNTTKAFCTKINNYST